MDPHIHLGHGSVADNYRRFAAFEAHGVSAVYEQWAHSVSSDRAILDLIAELPPRKRQPNLVFAAARHEGAGETYTSLRATMLRRWEHVRATILANATQTNEAARCAVLLPFLAELPQPLALLEVGAAAGLCLLPDAFSYRFGDGVQLHPAAGPSPVVIDCRLDSGITAPAVIPDIVWRAGIDLNPIDVFDPASCDWLETLIWPGQPERVQRLRGALSIARKSPPRVVRDDLLEGLERLADEAPADATLVVFHSAVLAYLSPDDRSRFVRSVRKLRGHWLSNEGQGVLTRCNSSTGSGGPDGRFLVSVDGAPRALADPHGRFVSALL